MQYNGSVFLILPVPNRTNVEDRSRVEIDSVAPTQQSEDWSQAGKLFGLGFCILLIWGVIVMLTARRQLFRRLVSKYLCCDDTPSPEKRPSTLNSRKSSIRRQSRTSLNYSQSQLNRGDSMHRHNSSARRASKIAELRRGSQQLVLLDARNSVVGATAPPTGKERRHSRAEPIMVIQDETGEEVMFYPVQPVAINEESEEDLSHPSSRASLADELRKLSKISETASSVIKADSNSREQSYEPIQETS